MSTKGIVLAGGLGTRLYPLSMSVSKHLMPVYDKPLIYYPISVLMLAGIKEILIISSPVHIDSFKTLLGDGSRFGVEFQYLVQESPNGIAQALVLAEAFISGQNFALILGDNFFYGQNFKAMLEQAKENSEGATIFAYQVKQPERFGVLELNAENKVLSIEEKPKVAKSKFVATGLYFYDVNAVDIAKNLKPSNRGELEISDVNKAYQACNKLHCQLLGRGFAWLDAGTPESLLEASMYVQTIEHRQGLKIACLEEIAYRNGWITISMLEQFADELKHNQYGAYLKDLLDIFNSQRH